ncbi:fungal-specific transcription factor domain-containing protein [Paraphoma chrysanthemicola]|uniref:Fungal-specific transcription factor domain-containing protein n=1 Tax=Paraphoma chrysanthemicola TaxID=798071 RepID=A0A8K0QXB2_9PLEO|nr:fungal-specific transcription factor domain-containing protein [Paraphoma chrysanthemicola]
MEHTPSLDSNADPGIPSCNSCRRRKLKCTREQPRCSNCDKFEVTCVYEYEKKKPGYKVGAIESLSRRLENVERELAISRAQNHNQPSLSPACSPEKELHAAEPPQALAPVVGALSSLTKEISGLKVAITSTQSYAYERAEEAAADNVANRKRRRIDESPVQEPSSLLHVDLAQHVQNDFLLEARDTIADTYFSFIYPWISILHEPSVRKRLQFAPKSHPFPGIFHAMVVSALRFVKIADKPLTHQFYAEQTLKARQEIMSTAMNEICIEHAQMLLILAFTELVDDNVQKAFALLGVVARYIDHLQLSLEEPTRDYPVGVFGKSHGPLPAKDWIEEEERRRLYWNAVMLDRLCASILGCATCLTGTRIHRRLPVCASFWHTNQPRSTPYIQVFDTLSSGPAQSASLTSPSGAASPSNTGSIVDSEKSSSSGIGALAFYIEAVESMGTIETHFLRQPVDCNNSSDLSRWLTRFKEMDAYLLRWKLRLPQQWKDSGISRRILPGVMDPAMTAANATHNTCLVLLHERIAYPEPSLSWVRLPSLDSGEICVGAATEVCTIIRKFIEQRPSPYAFAPQLGLCAFVSARSLLVHSRKYDTPLVQAFWHLLECLDTMALRWATPSQLKSPSLFSEFADRIRTIHTNCEMDLSYQIDRSEPLQVRTSASSVPSARHWWSKHQQATYVQQHSSEFDAASYTQAKHAVAQDSQRLRQNDALETQNSAFTVRTDVPWGPMDAGDVAADSGSYEDLLAISQSLLDPNFTSLNRIVSFEDMMLGNINETWSLR